MKQVIQNYKNGELSRGNIFACPTDKSYLFERQDFFYCDKCKNKYYSQDGVPNFITRQLPEEIQKEIDWYVPNERLLFNTYGSRSHELAHRLARNKLTEILKCLGANQKSRVLCVAVGSGEEIEYIKPITQNIYGNDISIDILRATKLKYGINVCLAEADKLPFMDESFDVVVVSAFLHHIAHLKNEDVFFDEFNRVLKNGGG